MKNDHPILQVRNALRQEILSRRDGLTARQYTEKSRALAERLGGLDAFAQARAPLFFASFRSEVETFSLMARALVRDGRVAVPRTDTRKKELDIFLVRNLALDLVPGYQGIFEPDVERCEPLPPAALDLVVVPGSVFDGRGGRMGYGGGYYDRFLANRVPQAIRVGICFDLQVVAEVPMAEHDQFMDFVVTESQIFGPCRGTGGS